MLILTFLNKLSPKAIGGNKFSFGYKLQLDKIVTFEIFKKIKAILNNFCYFYTAKNKKILCNILNYKGLCFVVYPGRESNPHSFNRNRILSPACLPVPPPGQRRIPNLVNLDKQNTKKAFFFEGL